MAEVKRFGGFETRKKLSTRGGFGLPIYLVRRNFPFQVRACAHLLLLLFLLLLMFFSYFIIVWLPRSSRLGILEGAGFVFFFFFFCFLKILLGEERYVSDESISWSGLIAVLGVLMNWQPFLG